LAISYWLLAKNAGVENESEQFAFCSANDDKKIRGVLTILARLPDHSSPYWAPVYNGTQKTSSSSELSRWSAHNPTLLPS
jgi:hypothetical protein